MVCGLWFVAMHFDSDPQSLHYSQPIMILSDMREKLRYALFMVVRDHFEKDVW